jgi:hypothetical protein
MATKVKLVADGAITASTITDTSITADKLHTTLDLTGKTVTVATATAGDNDTTVASTAFVSTAIANLADSAPSTLDTLNELAAALGDDANFSTTVTNSIATKAPLASPTFTGTLIASGITYPTSDGTNGQVLTTDGAGTLSFADGGVAGIVSSADATAITIDGDENILIGTDTFDAWYTSTNAGVNITNASNFIAVARSGGTPFIGNRLSSDGDIMEFKKDGAPIGTIGVSSSGNRVYFAGSGDSLCIDANLNAIFSGTTTGSGTNNTLDIGTSSTRFKDLYLSGTASVGHVIPNTQGTYSINHLGVYSGGITVNAATSQTGYLMSAGTGIVGFGPNGGSIRLGGTTAANELDDYEEGTWTPSIRRVNGSVAASYNTTNATYVKIGNIVHAKTYINSLSNGSSNGTGYWVIYNMPFAAQVETYSGVALAYNSTPSDNCYVGDAGGNAIFCVGSSPYSGTISGAFMLNITYRVN